MHSKDHFNLPRIFKSATELFHISSQLYKIRSIMAPLDSNSDLVYSLKSSFGYLLGLLAYG